MREAKERYRGVAHASVNDPRCEFLLECAVAIEHQLAEHVAIELGDITDESIAGYLDELRGFVLGGRA